MAKVTSEPLDLTISEDFTKGTEALFNSNFSEARQLFMRAKTLNPNLEKAVNEKLDEILMAVLKENYQIKTAGVITETPNPDFGQDSADSMRPNPDFA